MSSFSERSMLGKIITIFIVAVVAIALLRLTFWVLSVTFGLGAWLLFTLGPILLVGWIAMKVVQALAKS